MVSSPSPEMIETGEIVEGQACDFKAFVDLDSPQQRSNIVDDVVAFLNANPGCILVGIKEKAGRFSGYVPLRGDPEKESRRLLQILQDNIDPRPLRVDVRPMRISDGFLLYIDIPEHLMRPYQNRLNGAFYLRTGAKNTPLSRGEVASSFTTLESYERDVITKASDEEARFGARNLMSEKGPSLHIGILPREHYDRSWRPLKRAYGFVRTAPVFHHFRSNEVLRGCDGGTEANTVDFNGAVIGRTYVGSDCFVHVQAAHAFGTDESGRVRLPEFKDGLTSFLESLDEFFQEEGIKGPFGVAIAVRNLQRSEKVSWVFPHTASVQLPRPTVAERVAEREHVERLYALLIGASRYG